MRILINEGGEKGEKITIVLPTSLVLNRFTAGIISKEIKKYKTNISKKQLMKIVKEIKRYKRANKDWILADIESADGEKIKVKL